MNRNTTDLIILLALTLITTVISLLVMNRPTVEIQLYDTYFVIDRLTRTVLMLGPLIVLTFFPVAMMRKFKSIGTNIALIFGLVLVAVICYSIVELQSSYLSDINPSGAGVQQVYTSARKLIGVTQGILVIVGLSALVLIYRTVKIWKEAHSRPSL